MSERFSPLEFFLALDKYLHAFPRRAATPETFHQRGERLFDRLDPAHQLEKLSRFLWRRRRLALCAATGVLLPSCRRHGLCGVNVNTGVAERAVQLSDPDERFISDEAANLLYTAQDNRLLAYDLNASD